MKRFDMIFKHLSIILIFFNGVCLLYADEVKSFATEEEQQKYIAELIQKLPKPEKLMSIEDARKKLRTKEEVTAFVEALGRRGRFIIGGKVTDENGNLLEKVNLVIYKSASGAWESKQERQNASVNKYFVVFTTGCDRLSLYATKSGYVLPFFYKAYSLSSPEPEKNLVIAQDALFPLIKRGEILSLQKFDSRLLYDKGKQENEIFLLKSWKTAWETGGIEEPYLKIHYKRGEDGKVIMKKVKADHNTYEVPEEVFFELVSKNEKDGLLEFVESAVPEGRKISVMGNAPVEPYAKKLPLNSPSSHFYYFVDGKYGKGFISLSYLQTSRLMLFQNNENASDKKRNLWTE